MCEKDVIDGREKRVHGRRQWVLGEEGEVVGWMR